MLEIECSFDKLGAYGENPRKAARLSSVHRPSDLGQFSRSGDLPIVLQSPGFSIVWGFFSFGPCLIAGSL